MKKAILYISNVLMTAVLLIPSMSNAKVMNGAWKVTGECSGGVGPCELTFSHSSMEDIKSEMVERIVFKCLFKEIIGMSMHLRPYKSGQTNFSIHNDSDKAKVLNVNVEEVFVSDSTSTFGRDKVTWIDFPSIPPGWDGYDRGVVYNIIDIIENADKSISIEWNGNISELSAKGSTNAVKKFRNYCDNIK